MINATFLHLFMFYKPEAWMFNLNLEIMKKITFRSGMFVIIGFLMLFTVSCDMLPEEIIRESNLVGTWNFEDVTAEVYVGKVNITRVLVVSHGYTQAEAEDLLDSLVDVFLEKEIGLALVLNEDFTYLIDGEGAEDESGTWEFDAQKDALRLTKTGDQVPQKFTIEHLTQTSMIMHMPSRFKVIDLNGDGKEETNCTIVAEIQMVKVKPVN